MGRPEYWPYLRRFDGPIPLLAEWGSIHDRRITIKKRGLDPSADELLMAGSSLVERPGGAQTAGSNRGPMLPEAGIFSPTDQQTGR
jgi:hypothetical protein